MRYFHRSACLNIFQGEKRRKAREREKSVRKKESVKKDEETWLEIVIGFSSRRVFKACSCWSLTLAPEETKIDAIKAQLSCERDPIMKRWKWCFNQKCSLINAVNLKTKKKQNKNKIESTVKRRIIKMDYNKLKLVFIVLASKLIAAQNLNKFSYGELD